MATHALVDKLVFPILCVDVYGGSVDAVDSRSLLFQGNYLGYRSFEPLELYDSAGGFILVESVALEGNPGWLKRAWMRVINARCRIDYDSVKDLGNASLGDVKARLTEMAHIRRDVIESGQPFEEFLAKMVAAKTFEELCELYR